MSVTAMIQELAAGLEERAKFWEETATELEAKCDKKTAQVEQLTGDFIKSRDEVIELKKRLKKAEKEACRLKELLGQRETEASAGSRDGQENGQNEENCDNGKDPLTVFPEEVWRMIFGYLKEPQDLKSSYQTCTKFMWMLQDERKHFLFLDVLKVLQDHVEGFGLSIKNKSQWQRSLSKLIRCRSVCYGWKQSVDNFLQEDCPLFPKTPVGFHETSRTALRFTYRNPWDDAALRDIPMVSRFLAYYKDDNRTAIQNGFREFLQKFGHHVWFFKIIILGSTPISSWYSSLLSYLEFLPNLKALLLHKYDCEHAADLEEFVNQNPFPNIPTMKAVVLGDCPGLILESILTANPQIERLKIVRIFSRDFEYDLKSLNLGQLKELANDFKCFSCKELESVNCSLRKLTLVSPQNLVREWSELFQTLEAKFAGTLVEMILELRGPNPKPELRLNLPNLRILTMRIDRCFNSIDFIMPLANLECLKLDMTGMNDSAEEYIPIDDIIETIQFHDYTHSLKYSNIWRLFPKLKKVSVRTDRNEKGPVSRRRDDDTQTVSYEWQHCYRNEVD